MAQAAAEHSRPQTRCYLLNPRNTDMSVYILPDSVSFYAPAPVLVVAAEWQRSRAANSGLSKTPSGLWSKIFGFGKSTS
jgi:hypothetical protein